MGRQSWLDEGQTPLIDQYARQLGAFVEALSDGKVDHSELADQEKKVVAHMKELEPKLDDVMHAKVTQLLCDLTAYNIMQVLHTMHEARPVAQFRG